MSQVMAEGKVWVAFDPAGFPDRGAVISGLLTPQGFKAMYCGTWEPSKTAPLDELAAEYHQRCEAYDRTVCTGPIVDGSILPFNARERALISRNALAVRRELIERAVRLGFDREEFDHAMRRAAIREGGRHA